MIEKLEKTETCLLTIRPSDTYRNGEVVSLSRLIQKIIFFFKELFSGGRANNDLDAFSGFYQRISGKVQVLQQCIEQREDLEEAFPEVEKILKIQGRIAASSWGKNIKNSKDYLAFKAQVEELRVAAARKIEQNPLGNTEEALKMQAWIGSNELARTFAAYYGMERPPLKFHQLPEGAIILTNPWPYLKGHTFSTKGISLHTIILKLKAILCRFFAAERYTHAELSLGAGKTFDLDKKQGCYFSGKGYIKNRDNHTCFYDVAVPNKELLINAYNEKFPEACTPSFAALMEKIKEKIEQDVDQITASPWDIIRVIFTAKRAANYDSAASWDPQNKHYACSATISALFSSFGIDIGKQFGKMNDHVRPSDFLSSKFFTPMQVISE